MGGFIEIDGRRFEFSSAEMEFYHCNGEVADWNLALRRPGDDQPLWLSGSLEPGTMDPDALPQAQLFLLEEDIGMVFETLLQTPITLYADQPLLLVRRTPAGLHLRSSFAFDWDRALDPPGASYPNPRSANFDLRATIKAFHPGRLP